MDKPLSSQLLDVRADLEEARQLLWDYVEFDECVCKEKADESWTCLFCKAHKFLTGEQHA